MGMNDNEFVADEWPKLQRLMYRNSWNEEIARHRSPYVFRGITDTDHDVRTSLQRFVGESGKWELEVHLLRNFRQYARQEIDQPESPFHLMTLAQHHGLPTRLLDWTSSPAVAAYFATGGSPDTDGVLWAVDYGAAHELLPDNFQEFLAEMGTDMFNAEMLDDLMTQVIERSKEADSQDTDRRTVPMNHVRDILTEFSKQRSDDYIVFFEPPAIDRRIINQAALFSMTANPRTSMDEWFGQHPDLYWKIIIPAECKREFRDKLNQANINHRTLFPGLDGIARWLKEHCKPSRSQRT